MLFNLDPKEWSFLGGAASTLIAAVSYWAKTRHERRRATRTVLYYLLEVHHNVHRAHGLAKDLPAKFITLTKASLLRRGVSATEGEWLAATAQLTPMLRQFMSAEVTEIIHTFKEPLEKALAELAREDPVLAFRIRGRDRIMLVSEKLQKLVGGTSPDDRSTIAGLESFFRDVALKELQEAIYAAAFACDTLTLLKVHATLKRKQRLNSGVDDAEMQEFIDSMIATRAEPSDVSLP